MSWSTATTRLESTRNKTFSSYGSGFTGAIRLRTPCKEVTSDLMKVYVCLFTCATTIAVHLELVTDMTTNAFLRAFIRFAGRRSYPRLVISDNGSKLRASEIFVRQYFELPEVQQFLEKRRYEWKFIPARSPWQGDFYEIMVGVVKKCLSKILHH